MFKKLLISTVISVLVIVLSFKAGNYFRDKYLLSVSASNANSNALLYPPSTPNTQPSLYSTPTRIEIPTIGVDTNVEAVGLTQTGSMDVPSDPNDVAWYMYGPKPGETGNSVIDGHYDSLTGPAVFYKLGTLNTGDTIKITESNGKTLTFQVYKTVSYPNDSFPLDQIFSTNSGSANLNLITCSGVWDKSAKEYLNRRVVFSHLVKAD